MYRTVLKMVLSFFPKISTKWIEEVVFIHIVKKELDMRETFLYIAKKVVKNTIYFLDISFFNQ